MTRPNNLRRHPLSAFIGGICAAAWISVGWCQDAVPADGGSAPTIPLSEFLDLTPLALADDVQAAVNDVLLGQADSGASTYAGSLRPEYLSLQDALVRALDKNLSIALQRSERQRVDRVVDEARAVFLPVFNVSANFQRSDIHDREIFGTVIEKSFQPQTPLAIPVDPKKAAQGIPQINELGFRKQARNIAQKKIKVSDAPATGATESEDVALTIEQQLPWGAAFSLTTVSTHEPVYYDSRKNSYGRNWTTSLALNAAVPLPYTRNFGRYAPNDTAIKLALNDTDRAYWDLKTAVNTILLLTERQFWTVAARLEALRIVHANRQLVEAQAETTARMFDSGLVTRLGKAQIDAELARVKVEEEGARRQLLDASARLASLVSQTADDAAQVLMLPVDYDQHMARDLDLDGQDPIATAIEYSPELRAARIALERRGIERSFAETQARPDLAFLANINVDQKGDPIGYSNPAKSLANVADPDTRSYSVGLGFSRPWGNRAFDARLESALKRYEDGELGLRDRENLVEQSVSDALATVYTARERVRAAQANVTAAQDAYDRALRRRDTAGDVPELEVVLNSRRLLEAQSSRIGALVDLKVAEASLLAAEGIIANQYGLRLASNAFEQYRIEKLAAGNALSFFSPLPR